jgi:hypothetical protein
MVVEVFRGPGPETTSELLPLHNQHLDAAIAAGRGEITKKYDISNAE